MDTRRVLRAVTIDRQEIAALCIRMDCVSERLRQRVKNARALSHLTVSVTADELEAMSKQLSELSTLAKKAHGILRTEEIRTRPSEPIPING